MIQLFDYQEQLVGDIRAAMASSRRVLAVSPTGSGKTVMFSHIASRARQRGKRIGIFAHRIELVEQISAALRMFEVPHGIIAAGSNPDMRHSVFVCSAQTYARRKGMPVFDMVVIDEAHHCTTGSTWSKCLLNSPDAHVLGVTATPARLDGRGLGETFDTMVVGPNVRNLIDKGRLSDYRLFAPGGIDTGGMHTLGGDFNRGELAAAADKPTITGDAVAHYRKHLDGAPSAVFCASVEHAHHVADRFRAEGYTAAHIDGGMRSIERAAVVRDFKSGRLNILTSCDLISEGFDCPGMHGAILLRPTQSLGLHLQQVGRALRTCDGKGKATILDHAGNTERHGLPCTDREWSLDATAKKSASAEPSQSKECKICFARFRIYLRECPECGHAVPVASRQIDEVAGLLAEIDIEAERAKRTTSPEFRAQGRTRTAEGLTQLFMKQRTEKLGRPLNADEIIRQHRRAVHVLEARRRKHHG